MKHKKIMALLLAVAMLSGSFGYANQAQANGTAVTQTVEKEKAAIPEALKFLEFCDLKSLTQTSITSQQAGEMMAVINNEIKGLATAREQAQAIYRWIAKNISYDSNPLSAISANAYDVFTSRRGVCGGYANLVKEMMNLVGIPAVVVSGLYNGTMAHAWNAIYIDGTWILADATDASASHFDLQRMLNSHQILEITDASVESNNILLGYYHGLAAIGIKEPSKIVHIPKTYRTMTVTSIGYQFFKDSYGIEELYIPANISHISTDALLSSNTIKKIEIEQGNPSYASKDGVLFQADFSSLLVYPKAKDSATFTLPKQTKSFDVKEAFKNKFLIDLDVEAGNNQYSSYQGCLYDEKKTELLVVPLGKQDVYVYGNATINSSAFANADKSKIKIFAQKDSPAIQFAIANNMSYAEIAVEEPEEKETSCHHNFGKWEEISWDEEKQEGVEVRSCLSCQHKEVNVFQIPFY